MTNTAVKTFTAIETTEMFRNQIEEHIQERVEKIQETRTVVRGRIRRRRQGTHPPCPQLPLQL